MDRLDFAKYDVSSNVTGQVSCPCSIVRLARSMEDSMTTLTGGTTQHCQRELAPNKFGSCCWYFFETN